MADSYADYALTTGLNDGSDWTNAYHTTTPTQKAITDAGAGGRAFIKTDSAGTNNDVTAGSVTLTSPGTLLNPTQIYGCKNGTTATPPANSDLNVRGATDIPVFGTSGNNNDILMVGFAQWYGMSLKCGDSLQHVGSTDLTWWLKECDLAVTLNDTSSTIGIIIGNDNAQIGLVLRNVDFDIARTGGVINCRQNTNFDWVGGKLTHSLSVPTAGLVNGGHAVNMRIKGVDLTALGANPLIDASGSFGSRIDVSNCRINTSMSLITGTFDEHHSRHRMYNCSADTGISTSVIGLEIEDSNGTISSVTDRVHLTGGGGANDGAAGDFAWAMEPNANAVEFPNFTLKSDPIAIWLDGTETTVTVFIANNSASTDMQDDEVWLEVLASDSTLDTAQHVLSDDRMAVLGTPANQDDDTGSTWGSGANNHQKLVVTIAPGYEGWAVGYVHCCEDAASPKIVYVDPVHVLS